MADMRKCIGSARFGIEAHEAPVPDFPTQPSQKDGLGRMCKPHWNAYTTALRKAALARKEADGGGCPFGGTTPDECSTIRERSVAGISNDIPFCPIHGVGPKPTVQSLAAARVATKRAARVARAPKPEPIRTRPARRPTAEDFDASTTHGIAENRRDAAASDVTQGSEA